MTDNSMICDPEVFANGTSLGVFEMTREEAEQYCDAETKRTGYKHDWHFTAGRVHVKALMPKPENSKVAATVAVDLVRLLPAEAAETGLREQRRSQLVEQRSVLLTYLRVKTDAGDWHGVSDAANDLREIDAELKGLGSARPVGGG